MAASEEGWNRTSIRARVVSAARIGWRLGYLRLLEAKRSAAERQVSDFADRDRIAGRKKSETHYGKNLPWVLSRLAVANIHHGLVVAGNTREGSAPIQAHCDSRDS